MTRTSRRAAALAGAVVFAAWAEACNLLTGAADLDIGDGAGVEAGLEGAAGDGPSTSDGPASPDVDAATVDAGPRCDRTKAFGVPVVVPGLGTASEEFAITLTPDEKTAYLASSRVLGSGFDLYVATRSGPDAPFGPATRIDALSTASDDRHPSISADGTLLLFLRMTPTTGNDMFLVTKGPTGTFATAMALAINSPDEDGDPYLMPSGKTIYFATARRNNPGATGLRIHVSRQDATGTWSAPLVADGLENVVAGDPTPTDDELEMFVNVGTQIHYTSRRSKNDEFGAPTPVIELASAASDQPDWVSPDGCRLYFTSARDGGVGGRDIWYAQRGK